MSVLKNNVSEAAPDTEDRADSPNARKEGTRGEELERRGRAQALTFCLLGAVIGGALILGLAAYAVVRWIDFVEF